MELSIVDPLQFPTVGLRLRPGQHGHSCSAGRKAWIPRFWVAEHHGMAHSLAGTTPEVLLGHLAAETDSIRLGSGAVLLNHYSPFKVAELSER